MKKIMLLLIITSIGLSAQAFQWSNLLTQPYRPYSPYQPYIPNQIPPVQTTQVVDYATNQPYTQPYNNPIYCQAPYQAQYQGQYVNPYQYRPYNYANSVPYAAINAATSGLGTAGGNGIVKNIGQSVIYSLLRGY